MWVRYYPLFGLEGNTLHKNSNTPRQVSDALTALGINIRTARVRRRLTQDELAMKCDITRKTVYAIEKGAQGPSIGSVLSVLWALGLLDSVKALADPDADEHGKILEAATRPERVRAYKVLDNDF
ncbi:helix-turn-helix domain-containing protein [Massilia sp. YIM B02763]|uniref:helix-turn-helix transcriptional regulator n=1 Tax=Massilia sp. YIM B02763 TaxID=3050130 RepID=UPI0025B6C30A|nr:helix-turn-helix domain-containing protein [Massilia sp. YIM B02763]MDN4052258.1 helix-turn-helix domain-containing protein [Massilia sp. YIM B02763]